MKMSSRERLHAALHFESVDRLPWAPLMDGYFTSSLPQQGLPDDLLNAARWIGCDLLERHVGIPEEKMTNVEFTRKCFRGEFAFAVIHRSARFIPNGEVPAEPAMSANIWSKPWRT